MVFLKFLVAKLELFARINFCIFEACLSSIDRNISVNSDRSALFKSIFNNSLFSIILCESSYIVLSQFSLRAFKAPILNDFWFLFFVENFQNRNDHFMEI